MLHAVDTARILQIQGENNFDSLYNRLINKYCMPLSAVDFKLIVNLFPLNRDNFVNYKDVLERRVLYITYSNVHDFSFLPYLLCIADTILCPERHLPTHFRFKCVNNSRPLVYHYLNSVATMCQNMRLRHLRKREFGRIR